MAARNVQDALDSVADVLFPEVLEGAAVEISSHGYDGDTPLHVMCWREDAEGVQLLLQAGADPNAIGEMSETPLHVACRVANESIVRMLLAAGAKPDIRGEFEVTPFDIAQTKPILADVFGRDL
ncbi:ankyrin repeat protein [Roseimicrobium gellanilyticum]|uniref:Ankyrin repeat protein n=1 Tax=Roseimicrobium gellanilyticum TaxID=748857 RepID=A0A366HN39_9BACT|nr:ankyrin repeat domain-containing protein [Roseimicrobium gellanilyticum]RBP44423.1 ankyrin repeat protein [Roseimicrobium gellanilyticum]